MTQVLFSGGFRFDASNFGFMACARACKDNHELLLDRLDYFLMPTLQITHANTD
jgi:hypothetical protein